MHATERTSAISFRSAFSIKILAVSILFTVVVAILSICPGDFVVSRAEASVHAFQDGRAIYARSCSRCHGADGRAQTAKGKAVGASDFTSSDWDPDAARDIRIVTKGKGDMPSFKRTLKPADIQAVVTYIRRFKR